MRQVRESRAAPRPIAVENGKEASIEFAGLRCTFTPCLLPDGSVDIRATIALTNPAAPARLASPRVIVALGKMAEVKVGPHVMQFKPTLAQAP